MKELIHNYKKYRDIAENLNKKVKLLKYDNLAMNNVITDIKNDVTTHDVDLDELNLDVDYTIDDLDFR